MGLHQPDIVFGDASHLPDATAIADFNWHTFYENSQLLGDGNSLSVAAIPEYPHAVVRHQHAYADSAEGYAAIASSGVEHFSRLEDSGLTVPPHRFVVAPAHYNQAEIALYSITDRLAGRALGLDREDLYYTPPIIKSLATYMLEVYQDNEAEFMSDLSKSSQFTVPHSTAPGAAILHDTGLNLSPVKQGSGKPHEDFTYAALDLQSWANTMNVPYPNILKQLAKQAESAPRRIARRIIWRLIDN